MEDPFERLSEAIVAGHRRSDEFAEGLRSLGAELRSLGADLRSHTESVADGLRHDLRAYTDEKFEENRRHFQVLAEHLRGDIRLVAEGVVTVDEKVDRGFAEVRREISEGRAEVRTLFANHERRIRALEQR